MNFYRMLMKAHPLQNKIEETGCHEVSGLMTPFEAENAKKCARKEELP